MHAPSNSPGKDSQDLDLSRFFHTALDLLCIANTDCEFIMLNKSWESVLGYPLAELEGRRFIDYVHPEDVPATLEAVSALGKGKDVLNFINRYRKHNGDYAYIEWRAVVDGGMIYAAARDITSHIHQKNVIEESATLLSSFYKNAPLMMGIVEVEDDDIIHIRDNALSCQFFGRSAAEMANTSARKLGVDTPTIRRWVHYYRKAEREGMPAEFEYKHIAGGRTFHLSVRVSFIGLHASRKRYAYVINDTTIQKTAEDQRRRAETKYGKLVKTLPVGVFETETSPGGPSRFTFVSPKWCEITGLAADDVYADSSLPVRQLHPDDVQQFTQAASEAIALHGSFHWEGRKIIDGEVRFIEIQSNITRAAEGTIYVHGIESDITARKRSEMALGETKTALEQRTTELDMTLSASGIGIWELDLVEDKLLWDKHLRRLFLKGGEPLSYASWRSMVHPDDLEYVEGVYRRFLRGEGKYDVVYRVILANGTVRYHNSQGSLFRDENGVPVRVKGLSADITARKLIETELAGTRWVLEQTNLLARVGGWELDLKSDQLFWSAMIRDIFELAPDYKADPGAHLSFYKEGPARDKIAAAMQLATEKGEPWDLELEIVTGRGNVRWVRTIGKSEFQHGTCARIYGAIQDIEDRKQAESRILAAQRHAEAANRAKSEFLSNMSHEIRTPLNGVIGFTDLLLRTELDKTQQEYAATLQQSANSLLDIINDILDFSKIEAGKLEITEVRTDLYDLCHQAVDIIKYPAHKKDLELLVSVDPSISGFFRVDGIRLRQILINLLGNAAKFTPQGEIELKVEVIHNNPIDSRKIVRFAVRDTGIGIAPENQRSIFDAFSQEDGSISRRFGGTGLGLAISNKLLGLMGSALHVHSEQGKGSTFSFELALEMLADTAGPVQPRGDIQTVLVVDDHVQNRQILRAMLEECNVTCAEAGSGQQAVEQLSGDRKFDLIIMDYQMPGLNGVETLRKVRGQQGVNTHAVVLLYTSMDEEAITPACAELGIQHRLIKPVRKQQLYETMQKINGTSLLNKLMASDGQKGATLRALIVDDNATNILLAKSILRKINPHTVIYEAANGEEGVNAFLEHRPDIVFMDVQMPVMTGYAATERIRNSDGGLHVPIIALTAATAKGEKEKCLAAGMNDYLSKPVLRNSVERMLAKWIQAPVDGAPPAGILSPQSFSYDKLLGNMAGDEAIVHTILSLGRDEIVQSVQSLVNGGGEYEKVRSVAHKLKGTALNLCCARLAELARSLESAAAGDHAEQRRLVAEIRREAGQLTAFLSDVLARRK